MEDFKLSDIFYPVLLVAESLIVLYAVCTGDVIFGCGAILWGLVIFAVYAVRPSSILHTFDMASIPKVGEVIRVLVITAVVLVCILPMAWNPVWNGEIPGHHEQYEDLAHSFLEGHLYLDYEVSPELMAMENPYDTQERGRLNVPYRWDHAYYNGHYYMYFGVVPVFLLFIPYLKITGESLPTYEATQIFATFFIIGIFVLFRYLAKRFFPQMAFSTYLALSTVFSLISIFYCTETPSLYCTAISAGLCLELWSLYFFIRAAYDEECTGKKLILFVFAGALLGSLVFGCRPPVALANALVLILIPKFLEKTTNSRALILVVFALPYFLVGAGLMTYNYMRFDNPFEFGQAYMLTLEDQHLFGHFFAQLSIAKIKLFIKGIIASFFSLGVQLHSPYVQFYFFPLYPSGVLTNYPIFLVLIVLLLKTSRETLKEFKLNWLILAMVVLPMIITVVQIQWANTINERYHLDFYYLLSIAAFIAFGLLYSKPREKIFNFGICLLSVIMVLRCLWMFFIPYDDNFTGYYKDLLPQIQRIIFMGW